VTPLFIRPYRPSDLDQIIAVFQRAVREIAYKDYSQSQIAAWSTVDRARWEPRRQTRPTWVAEAGGTIAGFADLEDDGHLDLMYVHPDFQGRGIATALLATVEARARELRLDRIYAEASITARSFFERRGFRVATPDVVGSNGEEFTIFRIEKLLARGKSAPSR
jgi:putative acetyltransferase